MPDRPGAPDIAGILSEHARRLRILERGQKGEPPELPDEIDLYDEGVHLGKVTGLNFTGSSAAAIAANFIGTVDLDSPDSGWDAIVDSTLPASDPDNRLFLGIGEALEYLGPNGLNLNRALVLVRPGIYTEAANWTSPVNVVLFATVGDNATAGSPCRWVTSHGFSGEGKIAAYNMGFSAESTSANSCLGTALFAYNCDFAHGSAVAGFRWVSERVYTTNCSMSGGMRTMAGIGADHFQLDCYGGPTSTITLPDYFVAVGLRLAATTSTWNVDESADIDILETTSARGVGGGSVLLTIGGNATSSKSLKLRAAEAGVTVNLTGTQWGRVELDGSFRAITVPKSARCRVSGSAYTLDLTGPATVDLDAKPGLSGSPVIIRGDTVGGHITADDFGTSNGTILRLIAARYCTIGISGEGSATGGTQKLYDIDAASVGNTLTQAGDSTFPAASVNNGGATNRILPEGTVPFTTTTVGNVSGPASYATGGFVLNLSATFPAALSALMLQLEVEDADLLPHQLVVTRDSPAAGQATIKVMRVRYDKATAIGNVSGQPAGVTVQAASGAPTATEAAHTHAVDVPAFTGTSGAGQSAAIAPVAGVNINAADDATHTHPIDHDHASFSSAAGAAHAHVDDNIYEHQHGLTDTQTDAAYAELAAGTDISTAVWRYLATGS